MAIPSIAFGMGLTSIGLSRSGSFNQFRRKFYEVLRPALGSNWKEMPFFSAGIIVKGYNNYVDYWFRQSEKNVVISGLFTIIVLIGIPFGSVVNWLQGGSVLLLALIICIGTGLVILAITNELGLWPLFSKVLSLLVFIGIFLFIPIYAFYSFNDRILHLSVGHAAIGCLLIMPILYLFCQSVSLLIRQLVGVSNSRFIPDFIEVQLVYFVSALPIAYVLTFAALLSGPFSVADHPLPKSWSMLISSLLNLSICFSISLQVLNWISKRKTLLKWYFGCFLLALLGSIFGILLVHFGLPNSNVLEMNLYNILIGKSPSGHEYRLGPLFWIMHQTFIPFILIATISLVLFLTRVLHKCSSPKISVELWQEHQLCFFGGGALCIFGVGVIFLANLM